MNFVCVLSCVSVLLAAAAAEYPEPCVSPPLLTGDISMIADGGISLVGSISYDAYGRKVRVRSFGNAYNGTFVLDQLMLYNQEVYFEVNWSKMTCRKKQLDSAFIPLQVDPKAKPVGQAIMGTSSGSGMGMLVSNWEGRLPGNGTYFSTVGEIGCIPMTYVGFDQFGWSFVSTYNWVVGITDPNDLQIPPMCYYAQLEESEKPDTFFSALASLARQTARSD